MIKAGYKKTETGVSFGEIFEEMLTRKKIKGDDIVTFLGMQDLSEEASIIKQHQVLFSHVKSGFTYFERNDTLVAKITPCFENGKGAFLGELTTPIGFGSTEFHVLRAKDGNDPKYIYHHTRSDAFRKKLEKEMVGSAGHRRVPFVEIQKYWLPVKHNLAEQTAIAKALSDTDALIQSLSQLIAKKRQIKQGAMQTLLNPYDETGALKVGWVVRALGDVAHVEMGQSPSSINYNNKAEGLPLIQGNADIKDRKTIIRVFTSQITKRCQRGDTIMSVRAPVGEIAKATFNACIGRGVCSIRYINEYLYHYLIRIENDWSKLSKGSTFDSVNSIEVKGLNIWLPEDKDEQTQIAKTLTDMDTEITTLETKLSKYQKIKQGMMQNLLTGRIRLVTK